MGKTQITVELAGQPEPTKRFTPEANQLLQQRLAAIEEIAAVSDATVRLKSSSLFLVSVVVPDENQDSFLQLAREQKLID